MIPLCRPYVAANLTDALQEFQVKPELLRSRINTKKCISKLEELYSGAVVRLTKSCTQALEITAFLLDIQPGNEVILPSFIYVSAATAFVARGARLVYVDIDPNTLNINADLVERAITNKTRAIITVNYIGVSCDYSKLRPIADRYNIPIIEDNAMGIKAKADNIELGLFGDISTVSFDYLKNITCGEGGAIIVNNTEYVEQLHVVYENGTNKADYMLGKVNSYEWQSLGSNYYLSEFLSAILFEQLCMADWITSQRRLLWDAYNNSFIELHRTEKIELMIPDFTRQHNGHAFVIKARNRLMRDEFINYMASNGVEVAFHYKPLHTSPYGEISGRFCEQDIFTTKESDRLVRLPIYPVLTTQEQGRVIMLTQDFFSRK